jgi:ubiquinone/menaquinone biosynthesis C-methylase UbiE
MNPAWLYDEQLSAGREHLDRECVARYDTKAGFDPEPDIRLLQELGLNENSTLLDLGAGTGSFALAASRCCHRVIAVDVSKPMLAELDRLSSEAGIANVVPVHAGFLTYDCEGQPFDFIYSRNALHHLPDFWKAVAVSRMHQVLKPGGVLRIRDLVYSFPLAQTEPSIEEWLSQATTNALNGWTRAELETHVRTEHSTFSWMLEEILERAGFRLQTAEYSQSRIFAAYVCERPRSE